jgi:hypothetical protein
MTKRDSETRNLKGALDHLAWELVIANKSQPSKQTYFPISETEAKFRSDVPNKMKGMSAPAIGAIEALRPFGGGNESLWRLHALNNIDKHRTLVTVGSAFMHVDVGPPMSALFKTLASQRPGFSPVEVPAFSINLQAKDKMCPLKVGDDLYIDAPDAEPTPGTRFGKIAREVRRRIAPLCVSRSASIAPTAAHSAAIRCARLPKRSRAAIR